MAFGTDFFSQKFEEKSFRVMGMAISHGDGHLSWECAHPPFVHIPENPEFHGPMNRDRSTCPGCLLWHGWLPALAYPGRDSPGRVLRRMLPIISFRVLVELIVMISLGLGTSISALLTLWRAQFLLMISLPPPALRAAH